MSYNSEIMGAAPYYDDFDESKGYLRVLFRPGYAVQARELTQLQTILQNQVDRFADHIFENGSLVSGGQITQMRARYVRTSLNIQKETGVGTGSYTTLTDLADQTAALELMVGDSFNSINNFKGRIIDVIPKDRDEDPYHVVVFEFTEIPTSGVFEESDPDSLKVSQFTVTDSNTGLRYIINTATTPSENLPASGRASVVTTQPGLYYVNGYFVQTTAQQTVAFNLATATNNAENNETDIPVNARLFESPTCRIGFTVNESVVTNVADSSLLDPANGSPNSNAPGADRFKVSLDLSTKPFEVVAGQNATTSDLSDLDFVEILRFESGIVTKLEKYPNYANLENTLARRTYDESGNYTVESFDLQVREHLKSGSNGGVYTSFQNGDESKLALGVEPGRAYIRGYEFENVATEFVDVNKARTFDTVTDDNLNANIGNFVIVGPTTGVATSRGLTAGVSALHSEDHPTIYLNNEAGTTIGSALFRQIEQISDDTDTFRLFLYNISMNSTGYNAADTDYLTTTTGATIGFIHSTGRVGGAWTGDARFFNPVPNTLVFELPVKEATKTVTGMDHQAQMTFDGTVVVDTFTVSTPSTKITFQGTASTPVSGDDLGREYFLIGKTTNEIIDDFTGITFALDGDKDSLTVTFPTNRNAQEWRVIANVNVDNTNSSQLAFKRTKTLGSTTASSLPLSTYEGITSVELGVADIYSVVSVTADTAVDGSTDVTSKFELDDGQRDNLYDHGRLLLKTGESLGAATNFTVNFWYFQHSGTVNGAGDPLAPVTVDSYPVGSAFNGSTFGYANIPSFTSEKTGKTVSLRNAVDFRPLKDTDGNILDAFIPTANADSFTVSYQHYLPRIDKLVLTPDRRFEIIEGVPSVQPEIPSDDPTSMTLYVLRLGSYTFGVDDVEVRYIDNKRFTMRDIGKIEDRVDQIEYFTSLSLLEQEANSLTVTDNAGDIIPKTGVLVDNFNGHNIGNVTNPDYRCAMDFEQGELRPAFITEHVELVSNARIQQNNVQEHVTGPNNGDRRNRIYTLGYTTTRAIESILPSTTKFVNPTGRIDWVGDLTITPESDDWYSDETRPVVKLNRQGGNDSWSFSPASQSFGFGSQWNDWEFNWFGKESISQEINQRAELLTTRKVFDSTFDGLSTGVRDSDFDTLAVKRVAGLAIGNTARGSLAKSVIPDATIKKVGNRIINNSIQPFGRRRTIAYSATGMRPNTGVTIFIDNEIVAGDTTDASGAVSGSVVINAGQFRTGDRLIRLIDSDTNDTSAATTIAEAVYRNVGYFETNRSDMISTRPVKIRRPSVSEDPIFSSALSQNDIEGNKPIGTTYLAQNFTVDRSFFNNGMFVKSIDMLFSAKPSAGTGDADLPVTIEIRPTASGYPHPSRVIPGAVATKNSAEIFTVGSGISGNSINTVGQRNRFEFDYPVYLQPGEYSIIVKSNSDKYKVYTGKPGDTVATGDGTTVSRQPFVGALFSPQNAGVPDPDFSESMVFAVNRCSFNTNGTVTFKNRKVTGGANIPYDEYRLNATYLDFRGNNDGSNPTLSFKVGTTNEGSTTPNTNLKSIVANKTLKPDASRGTQVIVQDYNESVDDTDTFRLQVSMNSNDNAISPVLDAERLSVTCIRNDVDENSSTNTSTGSGAYNGELDPFIPASVTRESRSRYITKTIVLEDGMDSTDLRVYLKCYAPSGLSNNIQVFARVLNSTDTEEFALKNYIELTPSIDFTSEDESDFRDVTFSVSDNTVFGTFDVFAIKVVMHTTNQFIVPKARDLRVISLT